MVENNNQKDDFQKMSREEFQSKLYVCFEEKGVLSELRTHLRHQMIEALKTTDLGHKIASIQRHNQNISPKYQALNLLIAEYLLQQRYDYSLSVFSSEVPMLSSLPKFTHKFVNNVDGSQRNNRDIKFNDRDVWDILEALGLPTELDQTQEVYLSYQSSSTTDTLLVWLIRLLTAALRKMSMGVTDKTAPTIISKEKPIDAETDKNNPRLSKVTSSNNSEAACDSPKHKSNQNSCDSKKTHITTSTLNNDNELKIDVREIDNIISQLHDRMQSAFDHELEIARRSEWQQCRNMIEQCDMERDKVLEIEREKLFKIENDLREKLQQELALEKQRLKMEEKINLIEMQRKIERKLETERNLLKDEYRKIIQSKSENTSGIIHNQENSLKLALQTVEYQSHRFKEQEKMLSSILQELEKNSKKILNESTESSAIGTRDVTCQTLILDNSTLNEEHLKAMEKLKSLVDIQQKKMDELLNCTMPSTINDSKSISKVESVHKAVQTVFVKVKNSQTNTNDNDFIKPSEIESSVDSLNEASVPKVVSVVTDADKKIYKNNMTENAISADRLQPAEYDDNFQNSPQHRVIKGYASRSNTTGEISKKLPSKKNDITLDIPCDLIDVSGDNKSLSYILKSLRNENVYLKAFNSQQRLQIQELISNHANMKKEITNAHAEVQTLSSQLTDLAKANEYNQPLKSTGTIKRVSSAPSSYRTKVESTPQKSETSQELSEKRINSARRTIVDRILERRSNISNYGCKSSRSTRTKNCDKLSTQTTSDEENTVKDARRYLRYSSGKKYSRPNRRSNEMLDKTEDDTSPTDDVVKEAKKKLKMLELESEAMDRSYQEFKLRQSENLIESLSSKLRNHDKGDYSLYQQTSSYPTKLPLQSSSEVLHRSHKYRNSSHINQITDSIYLTAQQTSASELIQQMPFHMREHESPQYNIQRRVHEPTMKMDNSILQNYINTSQKMSEYLTKNPKSFADSLLRNIDYKKRNANPSVTFNTRCPTSFNRYTMKISDWDNSMRRPQIDSHSNSLGKNIVTDKNQIEKETEANNAPEITADLKNHSSLRNNTALIKNISVRRKLSFGNSQISSYASLNFGTHAKSEIYTKEINSPTPGSNVQVANDRIANYKTFLLDKINASRKALKEEDFPKEKPVDNIQLSENKISDNNKDSNNSISEIEIVTDRRGSDLSKGSKESNIKYSECKNNKIHDKHTAINNLENASQLSPEATKDLSLQTDVLDELHNSTELVSKNEDLDHASSEIEDDKNVAQLDNDSRSKIDSVDEKVLSDHENISVISNDRKNISENEPAESNGLIIKIDITNDTISQVESIHESLTPVKDDSEKVKMVEVDPGNDINEVPVNEDFKENDEPENNGENVGTKSPEIVSIDNKREEDLIEDAGEENDSSKLNLDNTVHPTGDMGENIPLDELPTKEVEDNLLSPVIVADSEAAEKEQLRFNEELLEQQDNNSNKSVLSDAILSEENIVESSFELSDHSAISIPKGSDENESFWN